MRKIINPEEECSQTPRKFSEVSQLISIDKEDCRDGIILDSPEELVQALIIYDKNSVEGEGATQHNLMDSVGDKGHGMGAILLLYAGAKNFDFINKLTKKVLLELKSKGNFYESFDYDAIGTNFFKTDVVGEKVEDKYILGLCAAYVGDKPEENMAKKLGKSRALISSNIKEKMSVVDDWWFNLNLEDILEGLPISKKQIKELPENLVSHNRNPITFRHKNQKLSLNIRLNSETYLTGNGKGKFPYYLQARGNSIVGGAWTDVTENYCHRCSPRVLQPELTLSISFPEKKGYTRFRNAIVNDKKMGIIKDTRDYLLDILTKKIN